MGRLSPQLAEPVVTVGGWVGWKTCSSVSVSDDKAFSSIVMSLLWFSELNSAGGRSPRRLAISAESIAAQALGPCSNPVCRAPMRFETRPVGV